VATLDHDPDRETEDRDAAAREEIRVLFERYRTTARRAEAGELPAVAEREDDLVLTGR
jgi:hypothetical protein